MIRSCRRPLASRLVGWNARPSSAGLDPVTLSERSSSPSSSNTNSLPGPLGAVGANPGTYTSPLVSVVMPSGFGEPPGSEAKRSTRPRSHAAASSGISARQASRNKAAREIADISPPRKIVGQSVPPTPQRQEGGPKKRTPDSGRSRAFALLLLILGLLATQLS